MKNEDKNNDGMIELKDNNDKNKNGQTSQIGKSFRKRRIIFYIFTIILQLFKVFSILFFCWKAIIKVWLK